MLRTWTDEQILDAFRDWEAIFGSPPKSDDWNGGWAGDYPTYKTVIRHFGSWQAAKDRASSLGRPKKRPPGYWTRERIVARYQEWAADHGGLPPPNHSIGSEHDLPSVTSLMRVFGKEGSREKAIRAAGLAPLPSSVTYQAVQKYLPLPRRSSE